jgi:hypothetical protein
MNSDYEILLASPSLLYFFCAAKMLEIILTNISAVQFLRAILEQKTRQAEEKILSDTINEEE